MKINQYYQKGKGWKVLGEHNGVPVLTPMPVKPADDCDERWEELEKYSKQLSEREKQLKKEQEAFEIERKKLETEKAGLEVERKRLEKMREEIEQANFDKSELKELMG